MTLIDRKLLEQVANTQELDAVLKLDIVVDTCEQTLTTLAELMPNLAFLNISYSRIGQLSTLGSFQSLQVLLADSCYITLLDGLFLLPALEKLSLRNNRVSELAPLLDCAGVVYFDIADNDVGLYELQFLSHLPLKTIVIEGNPCNCDEGRNTLLHYFPDVSINYADYHLLKDAQRNSAQLPINAATHMTTDAREKTIISGTSNLVATPYSWWKHWDLLRRAGVE